MTQEPAQLGSGDSGSGDSRSGPPHVAHRVFEEHVRRAPGASALVCGPERLSYGELDASANRLARHLRERGLRPGGLVAVALGRTPDVVIAMLGILKAGGAYIPVEPSGPDEIFRHVLADAGPFAVITHAAHRVRIADATDGQVICLDTEADEIHGHSGDPIDSDAPPTSLACVFYTSGSTGLPKGALIEHRNLMGAFHSWQEVYRLTPADRHLQTTSFEFDGFTADWIRALCSGGTLVMAQRNFTLDRTADIDELRSLITSEAVTVVGTNVLTLRRLYAALREHGSSLGSVRLLCVGADKWHLDEQLELQEYLGDGVRLLNVYGVAEASVDSTYFDARSLPPQERIEHPERVSLVGVPFPGKRIHILDGDGRPVPAGEPGEICVAGPAVGRGYHGDPDLTAARFQDVDFDPDGRVYRTGDIGVARSEGIIEFLGRVGLYTEEGAASIVELARMEGALRGHPAVKECLVADIRTDVGADAGAGRSRTVRVAYVVAVDGAEPVDPWELRSFLSDTLRVDSAPEAVMPLPRLPRTRAGKVDRLRLPLPALRDPRDAERAGARSETVKAGIIPRGKAGSSGLSGPGGHASGSGCAWVFLTALFTLAAVLLTDPLWPTSTDVSLVPSPWAELFRLLYGFESVSFGLGIAFLFLGRPLLARLGRPPGRTRLAHLSIAWLLAAWWPQDNAYRITRAFDWSAQAKLVYGFNVTLMIAAGVVVWFLAWSNSRDASS